MIKINLLPTKRPKRMPGRRIASDPSSKHILYGVFALAAAGLGIAFLFDLPMRSDRARYEQEAEELRGQIRKQDEQPLGFAEMQKAQADAEQRKQSIDRLMRA